MKKTLIALAVAAVAATSANAAVVYQQDGTKVEVGGSIRLVLSKKTDKRGDLEDNGSRIVVKGTHDLGEGFSVLGSAEIRFTDQGDIGNKIHTKRLFAGFDHKDIGTLTFGKQLTTADDFGVADPTYKFGATWARFSGQPEYFQTEADKVIKFKSKSFEGFSLGMDYVFGTSKKSEANNSAYLAGLFYDNTFDGVNVKAEIGYTHNKLGQDSKARSLKSGVGVGFNGLFVGVDYARSKKDAEKPVNSFQVGVNYQITDMAKVYSAFRHTKQDVVKEKGFAFGVGYKPHKLVETFVEYNTFKKTNTKRDNALYLGARVHF